METRTKILVVLTLLLWGIIPILDKKGLCGEKVSPLTGMFVRVVMALGLFLVLLVLRPDMLKEIGGMSWWGIFIFGLSGIFSVVISQYCYYEALKDDEVSRLFPVLFGGAPVVGGVLAFIFLGEQVTLQKCIGMGFIAIGSFIMFL